MEINLENKAKFLLHSFIDNHVSIKCKQGEGVVFSSYDIQNDSENYYAELKPISSISVEDASAITIYHAYKPNNLTEYGYTNIEGFKFYTYNSVDYLRSKGYAMPFHDLSVKQMVEAGWIKLQEG